MGRFWCPVNLSSLSNALVLLVLERWLFDLSSTATVGVLNDVCLPTTMMCMRYDWPTHWQQRHQRLIRNTANQAVFDMTLFTLQLARTSVLSCYLADMSCCWTHQQYMPLLRACIHWFFGSLLWCMYRISTLHELGGSCKGLSAWVWGREHDHDFETVNETKSKQLFYLSKELANKCMCN